MEAGVGIEPASTALQAAPTNRSQQSAAGDNNNIRHLHRGQQSAIMSFVVATVPILSQANLKIVYPMAVNHSALKPRLDRTVRRASYGWHPDPRRNGWRNAVDGVRTRV